MQEMILAKMKGDKLIYFKDRTPSPFTSIDVPAKGKRYSTLSGGLYEEVHGKKALEEYGRLTFDTRSRRIVKMNARDNFYFTIDPAVFALSVDPMTIARTSWTPYNAFRDNPILNIDPTGALDTKYEDEDGNELANTNDGNNSTVTVRNSQRAGFDKWLENSEASGKLNDPDNNMNMIHALTPANKGVYFTNSSFGLQYMNKFSMKDKMEYSGYLLSDGLFVEATQGYDLLQKQNTANDNETSGIYTGVSKGSINLADGPHKVSAYIHTHPYGQFWSGVEKDFKGNYKESYYPGDFQVFSSYFAGKAGVNNFYLLQGTLKYEGSAQKGLAVPQLRVMNFRSNKTVSEGSMGDLRPYLNGQKKLN